MPRTNAAAKRHSRGRHRRRAASARRDRRAQASARSSSSETEQEEGRCARWGPAVGGGRAYRTPTTTCTFERLAKALAGPAERRGVGQQWDNTANRAPTSRRRPRVWADTTQGTASCRLWDRAGRSAAFPTASRPSARITRSLADVPGASATAISPPACSKPKARRLPRALAPGASPEPGGAVDHAYMIRTNRCHLLPAAQEGCAWAARRCQHRRRHSAAGSRAGPHHRAMLCDYGTIVGCSTRPS